MLKSVTVLGLGAIGLPVARALARGEIDGLALHSVAARSAGTAERLAAMGADVPVLGLDEVGRMGGIVVECLPPQLLAGVAGPVLGSGRTLLAASIGGLLRDPGILAAAEGGPGRLVLPSGALGGLDGVRAIARHPEAQVGLETSKPVSGFEQSAYLSGRGIELSAVAARTCLFEGTAGEGVRLFPKNVNVVAALALAGVGPERTRLSLWADPALRSNVHRVEARSPVSHFVAEMSNLPDPENPRTSAITAFSILSALRNLGRNWRFM